MIWVGSFKSLQTVLGKHRFTGAPLDVHTRVRSEIALISPLVDWLMNLIAISYGASVGLVPANALVLTLRGESVKSFATLFGISRESCSSATARATPMVPTSAQSS
jgi:hypothetical protein